MVTLHRSGHCADRLPRWTRRAGTVGPRTPFMLQTYVLHGFKQGSICAQPAMSSPGPPARVEEGGVMYPVHDSDSEISYETEVVDKGASGDPGFYPELPFELGEDFIEEIRKYLVEEEGMDDKDEAKLTVEVMRMAEDLCEMSIADEDPALDDEIAEDVIEGMTPYVEAQEKWEQSQENAKEPTGDGSDLAEPSSDVSSDEDVPWIDDLCGWDTPEGMPMPDNVSREAIAEILAWDKECEDTREGPRASMGWQESRGALHPAVTADIMGLKGWRLGLKVHPKLAELAANIEATWRQLFPLDLGRTDVDPRWRFIDSVDPNHVWGLDYGTEDPELGTPRYPRLVLENRFYQTTKFRCLHLEIGLRQDGFQVLHCVMWPRRDHDIPILGFDLVAVGSNVTYAIADTTPVSLNGSLPPVYVDGVRLLKAQFADGITDGGLPDWGQELFSQEVVSLRPDLPVEADLICMHFTALLKVHILYSKFNDTELDEDDDEGRDRVDKAHRRYCDLQLKNDKTSAVLKNSFKYLGSAGDTFVQRYMTEVLFDHAFHYDVDEDMKTALRENRSDLGNPRNVQSQGAANEMVEQVMRGFQDPPGDEGEQAGDQS